VSFSIAIDQIDPSLRPLVETQLASWEGGGCLKWARVTQNIRTETALSVGDFVSLLNRFAENLGSPGSNPEESWKDACRAHQFRGAVLTDPYPAVIGRASSINDYARLVSRSATTILSEAYVESMLQKIAMDGASANPREMRILRRALLGEHVIWATFHPTDSAQTPFDTLPRTTEAVRTALGLGHCSETETLILLTYSTSTSGNTLELFRPTLGEAGDYCWYCPHQDPDSPCGMTAPLPPNVHSLPAMPEVVHREIHGATLVFPLYLTT